MSGDLEKEKRVVNCEREGRTWVKWEREEKKSNTPCTSSFSSAPESSSRLMYLSNFMLAYTFLYFFKC